MHVKDHYDPLITSEEQFPAWNALISDYEMSIRLRKILKTQENTTIFQRNRKFLKAFESLYQYLKQIYDLD